MSIIIGITVLPARFTRVAPAGTRTSAGRADLGDLRAVHDQCRVLDHASVAHDQPRAFERGDGLRGRRNRASGKETKGNDCRDCDHIHSVHGNLLMKYAL